MLKEKFGKKRIVLNDDQRRRLAVKGKLLGRKVLEEIGTAFTPDTILRWHRQLVAQKWDHCHERTASDRPATPQDVVELILKFARENPVLFGESALRNATSEFLSHYHRERAHQGLDHQILEAGPEVGQEVGAIVCRERLDGLLKYCYRQAA